MITGIDFVWLPVVDMTRARDFYEGTLGLVATSPDNDQWVEYDMGDGPALGLVDPVAMGNVLESSGGAAVGFAASDFTWMAKQFRAMDILDMAPFETDGCHGGPAHDPEGNGIILHQRKAEPTRDKVIDFLVLPVADMARARAFYEGKLGLTPDTVSERGWTEYVLPDDSALALFCSEDFEAAKGSAVGLQVPELETAFASLKAAGFARVEELLETPVCHMGFVRDSEGNSLVLHRRK